MRDTRDVQLTAVQRWFVRALVAGAGFVGCGPKAMIGPEPNEPPTQPEAAGAAEHRAAAKREERRLARHQELYDPNARQEVRRCDPASTNRPPGEPICWVETMNPTAVHLEEVERHRVRAADHRKAARELRAVEEQACAGLAPDDRDISPFSHRGDILGVSPLEAEPTQPRSQRRIVGATVLFRPVPGLTVAELQQLLDCHLARNATIGYETASSEMGGCLLTRQGTRATVRALESGFAVDVRGDSAPAGHEIWRRAQLLASTN
jgi:hypothetical protein